MEQIERPPDEDEITEPTYYVNVEPNRRVQDSRAHERSGDPDDD